MSRPEVSQRPTKACGKECSLHEEVPRSSAVYAAFACGSLQPSRQQIKGFHRGVTDK